MITNEELFEKYSIRLSLAYEGGGAGVVKHWDYLMAKEGFLQALAEAVKNLSSNLIKSDSLTFEECLREEFLINTQNYPQEYHNLFIQKFNRAKKRFEEHENRGY